jgi:signal transduction histidine kinase
MATSEAYGDRLAKRLRTNPKRPELPASARSKVQDELTEVTRHRAAISEVLRAIASSPNDMQPIFDAICDSAERLCEADVCHLRLSEKEGFRLVALTASPDFSANYSPRILWEPSGLQARLAASRSLLHFPDLAAHELYRRGDPQTVDLVDNAGLRTVLTLAVHIHEEVIGILAVARRSVRPFTDRQIELMRDFSAETAIALEIIRHERRYREAQMALAHANRVATIGQLTASITHEVKQPLAAARNNLNAALNFLDRTPPDLVEVSEALASAAKDNDRASTVVGRIRALVQKAPTRIDSVNVNEAVREVIELTYGEALKNRVSVRTQLADGLPLIQGDRVQLQQVVVNLILNAIQAMGAVTDGTREVLITTSQTGPNEVCLVVQDTGPGLSPESLPRLFEPFYTTKPEGMGMGLYICRSIIEAHGGRLWATPCEPQGALFQFTIPSN